MIFEFTKAIDLHALADIIIKDYSSAEITARGDLEVVETKAIGLSSDDLSAYSTKIVITGASPNNTELETYITNHTALTAKTDREKNLDKRKDKMARAAVYVLLDYLRDYGGSGAVTDDTDAEFRAKIKTKIDTLS